MVKKILASIALLIPVVVIFRNIFFGSLPAWGDAPYFYPEATRELAREPLAWTQRGASFGGINNLIWISPLMFLYGLIGNSDIAIKFLFYFPSILLAGTGVYFFTKYLRLSGRVQLVSILLYLLNTYFLLLIDGGQVGIALAYGLFPLAMLFTRKFVDSSSVKSFCLSLGAIFLLSVADPRIGLIAQATGFIWLVLEKRFKKLSLLLLLFVSWLGLSMYWIYPLLRNGHGNYFPISEAVKLKWYHPLFLYSPHWPENLFGQVTRPPFYFLGIPMLIFLGAFLKKGITYLVLFLIFSLLVVGIIPFDKIPFGSAFRDTTKFFIPLMLFSGILIGYFIEAFKRLWVTVLVFLYLLFLVHPAVFGNLNFVLSQRPPSDDFVKIYEHLKKDEGFFRTVWFPEKHPLAFDSESAVAVDGRDLAGFWPFASINTGEDVFNFLNNDKFVDWVRVLGIKYLVLSDNPREIGKTEKDEKDWNTILNLVKDNKNLEEVNLGTDIPVYRVDKTYPRSFAYKKLVGVVGPSFDGTKILANGIYFEDGKWNPATLDGKDAESLTLAFNGTDKVDLAMSFLQKYFVLPSDASRSQWAVYGENDYLKYKYELLIRGVKFNDFDYGKGIGFSSVSGEEMEFSFWVDTPGEYVFISRTMSPSVGETNLSWRSEVLNLPKGVYKVKIKNDTDIKIVNVVGLVPKKDYDAAIVKADVFVKHFGLTKPENIDFDQEYRQLDLTKWGTLRYNFKPLTGYHWLVYSDKHDPLWKLKRQSAYHESFPIDSMITGFYFDDEWTDLGIEFLGQKNLRFGIYWTLVSGLVIGIICLMKSRT